MVIIWLAIIRLVGVHILLLRMRWLARCFTVAIIYHSRFHCFMHNSIPSFCLKFQKMALQSRSQISFEFGDSKLQHYFFFLEVQISLFVFDFDAIILDKFSNCTISIRQILEKSSIFSQFILFCFKNNGSHQQIHRPK